MNILSIQSHVAYGHVGNSSAVFPLQRLGVEVWPIHTVQFSNHTGYGAWRGQVFDAAVIGELVEGIEDRGRLVACDGVLSGYMGSAEIGSAILDAVVRVRAANPRADYCCDPVIGDVGRGIFVRPGIPEFLRQKVVPAADIVTPNQFELEFLTGHAIVSQADVMVACDRLHAMGPKIILVTSVLTDETPIASIDLLASGPDGRFLLRTPRLDVSLNGAGDAVAALFFLHLKRTGSAAAALSAAGSSVYGLLRRTFEAASKELLIVEAQDELVQPTKVFEPYKI
ncbi:pyridoxine kinase [Pseudorhizobium tarimense]|uniref:pyridoxal kinase n=1 Tax=Pseudorhizobium tarimense TaxID=1079109 RepID=A0ABV2HDL1_9HYPH|nr:pyridoxal kinase PdxY [Pseudorhizobium tarimense]MCJ8521543.1 pyridoxal kinase PdxY [Pseudorhizobium tarimense]